MDHVNLSTQIDAQVKAAVTSYCKSHGIKLRHFIEQALVEQLEDLVDLQAYHDRKHEETMSFEEVLRKS